MTRRRLSFYTGTAVTADSFATLARFDGRGHPGEPSGDFSFDLFDCRTGIWRHVAHGKDAAESATLSFLSGDNFYGGKMWSWPTGRSNDPVMQRLAEAVGFEPTEGSPPRWFSRPEP